MAQFTRKQINWNNLFFYQKAVVLDQLTFRFCARFLPKFGDRTVDQMVQAARSGKQNIVEGLADDVTSSELAIKLLNVARASLKGVRFESVETFRRWRCHTQSATDSICAGPCGRLRRASRLPSDSLRSSSAHFRPARFT